MIILQAGYLNNQFHLWGESPADSSTVSNGRRRRKSRGTEPEALPYDPGAEGLADALAEVLPSRTARAEAAGTVVLWLPTVSGRPIPSTPLVAPLPEPAAEAVLSPWAVKSLGLGPDAALELLCACIGKETLATGLLIGKTLAFWATAVRFAGALVAREQFLPGLRQTDQGARAGWEPIVTGPDAKRLAQLVRAMPPACRALSATAEAAPVVPAASLMNAFLGTMVDALVRSAVGTSSPARHPAASGTEAASAVEPDKAGKPRRRGRPARKAVSAFASSHDHWLAALQAPDSLFEEAPGDVAKLAEHIEQWRQPVTVSTSTPFRLCFRLEDPKVSTPEDDDAELLRPDLRRAGASRMPAAVSEQWYLRYFLQGLDDPSLLIPMADAWTARGRKAAVLRRESFDARAYALSALGQATGLCPFLETSLRTATPAGCELDVTGAHGFLSEKAWLLEQAGFGVLLPAWWTGKGTKLRFSVRAHVKSPKMQGGSGLSMDDLVHFDWQVALGDQLLSREELETLAQLKAPLVQVRGQWVQVTADEIQAALDLWRKKPSSKASVREVMRMALGGGEVSEVLAFEGVTAAGWIKDLLARLQGSTACEELPPPGGFSGTLRPYQGRGYSWLGFLGRWGLGACLADDMGLGKTVQTLALLQREWEDNDHRPTLLICPMSVVGNWQKEAQRFTPELPVLVHHGTQRRKDTTFREEAEQQALVISSYALLHRDLELFQEVPWRGVILDEAQNIKNPQTKQAQAARAIQADYRIALTGTPVENHVGDLWSVLEFLNPGFLGTQADFKRRFFVPIQAYHDPEATARLKRLTGPFILRRLKTDKTIIADLPDKLEMKVYCNLTREQASLYAAVVEDANRSLDKAEEGIQRKGVILATLSKLKQVCNHPAQFLGDNSAIPGRSGKLARLTEMLEEALETGDKALIFTQFREMGTLMKRHLEEAFGREVLFLHGGVTKKQRDLMIERFQASAGPASPDDPRVFLLSLKAGGTGLNLTAANHVFHFDRWWNPAVENQATDRAFRIGQTRAVQVHKFICVGTLEEKIDAMIEAKQQVAGQVIGTGEAWLTELSNEQLRELFALRQEALGE